MATLSPISPIRADHRFIQKIVNMLYKGKVYSQPSEFDRISDAFVKIGGTWEGIFKGSPADTDLLKRIVKMAYKKGFLTNKEKWTGKGKVG